MNGPMGGQPDYLSQINSTLTGAPPPRGPVMLGASPPMAPPLEGGPMPPP